jgi:hypothetical protein
MSNFPFLYKKTVEHLDTRELFLIYRASKGFFPEGCNKQVLLLLIEDSHPGFLSDKTKFFYFKQKDVKSVHYLKNKIDDPNNEHELKKANQNNRNDVDKILADTKEEKEAEIIRSFCAHYERSIPSTIHNRDQMFDRLEHIVNKIETINQDDQTTSSSPKNSNSRLTWV